MQYLKSVISCDLGDNSVTESRVRCLERTEWIVGILYAIAITVGEASIMISFPGYYNAEFNQNDWTAWADSTYTDLYYAINSTWTLLCVASTAITIYAIFKIAALTNDLSKNDPNVQSDRNKLIFHATLLAI